MVNVSLARRYARALLEAATGTDSVETADHLSGLAAALEGSPELADAFVNPAFGRAQRIAVLEALLRTLGIEDPLLGNFLRLLVDRSRVAALPDIARLFRDLADARGGRLRGQVVSAVEIAPESIQALEEALGKATRRSVTLETRVDPAVIGGVSTQVGSVVYDGTLRTQLDELKRALQR